MRLFAGIVLGAGAVVTVWTFWRPALRYLLSRGDEPYHP